MVPRALRCEYLRQPIGIDVTSPRLSWRLRSVKRGARQLAYRVEAASSAGALGAGHADLWDSGRVDSDQSQHVVYTGAPLRSRMVCHWRVTTWSNVAHSPTTSSASRFEMGLLQPGDWAGQWITDPARARNPGEERASYITRTFELRARPKRARLYASALGLYVAEINGRQVSDDVLRPGWTDYAIRVPYQSYDVASLLQAGENCLAAILGDGWYCGHVAWLGRGQYGTAPRLRLQLEVTLADGSELIIATDPRWRASFGPILSSDLMNGERYDARLERADWSIPGGGALRTRSTVAVAESTEMVAQVAQPVRRTRRLRPVSRRQAPNGETIFDLGQNMVGWVRLRVRARRGQRIGLRHAEMLDPVGNLYIANLRGAAATDTYTCGGNDEETYEPTFTFHGFRYVGVSGIEADTLVEITGVVVRSNAPEVGTITTSSPMLNRLQRNIQWSQRGNFLEVPTDCPQRDERAGWLCDAQVFVRTATYNMDVAAFFTKWMRDVVDAQQESGAFTDQAPRVAVYQDGSPWPPGAPGWGDGGVIVPWTMHQVYGDTRIIDDNYAAMRRWIDFIAAANPDCLWRNQTGNNYGDWFSVGEDTPKDLVATAYFAHSTQLLSGMAEATGRFDDARGYGELAARIRAAFTREFLRPTGRLLGDTQTGYVLALHFDILPEAARPVAVEHLISRIESAGWHLSTGFLGVGHLLPVLSRFGCLDVAYRLLNNVTFPSWGYCIAQGATTLWERWDGWSVAGGFQDPFLNSFNHYSLGSVGAWLFSTVAGIDIEPATTGYQVIRLAPRPGGGLHYAKARLQTPHGLVRSEWRLVGEDMVFSFEVPANTTAHAILPAVAQDVVFEGGTVAASRPGITALAHADGVAEFRLESGSYELMSRGAAASRGYL
ncbi:MAG: family 78 glycoside hydrolase catalytic domain [Candidatus Dormibacteria bacterium]